MAGDSRAVLDAGAGERNLETEMRVLAERPVSRRPSEAWVSRVRVALNRHLVPGAVGAPGPAVFTAAGQRRAGDLSSCRSLPYTSGRRGRKGAEAVEKVARARSPALGAATFDVKPRPESDTSPAPASPREWAAATPKASQ